MDAPTREQLLEEELGDPVQCKDDTSWRHGSYRTEVYHRQSDGTYWRAKYCVSTDGETNGLRDEHVGCKIVQVWPVQVTVTEYQDKQV